MVVDPIADMLVRIKNAGRAGNEITVVPYSKLKFEISNVLLKKGYIKGFSVKGKKVNKRIEVEILYNAGKFPRIEDARRISRPSRRVYLGSQEIKAVRHGEGMAVLSTPRGLLSGDDAKKEGVGGEILFNIW